MKESKIAVSIIIPVYNVSRYLRQALDSAVSQTLKEIEIIAVDDGSTDDSGSILDDYALQDQRIHVIHKKNTGYGHTMNVGIEAARGKYIAVLESDDMMNLDMLQTLYSVAETLGTEITKSDFIKFYGEKDSVVEKYCHSVVSQKMYYKVYDPQKMEFELFASAMMTWNGIIRRDFLEKWNIRHNETPGAAYQDNGFWFQLMCRARRVVFIEYAGYKYRIDNPSSSVRCSDRIYSVNEEYSYIYSFLFTRPELHKFFDIYWYKKYENCVFTIKRIEKQYRSSYAKHMVEEFRSAYNKGELKKEYFIKQYWNEVMILLQGADKYLEYKNL